MSVSRKHATFYTSQSSLQVEDLNSTYGTAINGYKILPKIRVDVNIGDCIKFGQNDTWTIAKTAACDKSVTGKVNATVIDDTVAYANLINMNYFV